MPLAFLELVLARADVAGVEVDASLAESLARYLTLLARWNRRINLTSFDLDRPNDAAIDRLVVESLLAARHVPVAPLTTVDIGSGGGSPAIPLNLVRPALQMTLVEARERKSAFLREAARALGLTSLLVETETFEDFSGSTVLSGHVDLITMRAVRADDALWRRVVTLLKPGGRVLWFVDFDHITNIEYSGLELIDVRQPVAIFEKAAS